MTTESFDAILELQDHDTRLDQLRHRLRTLPERTRRDDEREALAASRERAEAAAARRDDLTARQRRLQDETATLDGKRAGHQQKLYDGSVTNPRELQDLQAEVDSLSRRISDVEDLELEVMEELEPVEAELAAQADEEARIGTRLDVAEAELIAAEAEIESEMSEVDAARTRVSERVDADLLAEYRSIRAGRGGIAVARLVGERCGACQLTIPKMAVASIKKHRDRVHHCEECGSILLP